MWHWDPANEHRLEADATTNTATAQVYSGSLNLISEIGVESNFAPG
jgi:hypothetical protein